MSIRRSERALPFLVGNVIFVSLFFAINYFYNDSNPGVVKLLTGAAILASVILISILVSRRIYSSQKLRLSSLLIILTLGTAPWRHTAGPDVDMPHYLTAAYSIWFDGDLQVENNYKAENHRYYYYKSTGGWKLPDNRMKLSVDGQQLFWPSLGIPVLNAALSFIPYSFLPNLLLANLLALALWGLWNMSPYKTRSAAILLIAGPWTYFTAQGQPDTFAFILVVFLLALRKQSRWWWMTAIGSLMPWLKPPYVFITGLIMLSIVLESPKSLISRQKIAQLICPTLSIFGICYLNLRFWGHFSLTSAYGGNTGNDFSLLKIFSYYISAERGIVWALPPIGAALIFMARDIKGILYKGNRDAQLLMAALLGSAIVYTLAVLVVPDEGWCGRCRYFMPFLPLMIPTLTEGLEKFPKFPRFLCLAWMISCWILLSVIPSSWPPFGGVGYPFSIMMFEPVYLATPKIVKPITTGLVTFLRGNGGSILGVVVIISGLIFGLTDICKRSMTPSGANQEKRKMMPSN